MSNNGSRRNVSESVPGDEQGPWPRERLLKMDEKFCARFERAIRRGQKHTPIRFTDHQLAILRELAAPLAPSQRSALLQDVARAAAQRRTPRRRGRAARARGAGGDPQGLAVVASVSAW